MAVTIVKSYPRQGYVDKAEEIASLDPEDWDPGDALAALDDGSVWIFSSQRIWVKFGGDS